VKGGQVVLVLGEERFLAREAVRELLAEHEDADRSRYQGGSIAVSALLDELRTPSLFGSGRVVVVEEAAPLFEEEFLAALADYSAAPAAGTLLVLVAKKIDGRRKAAKALKRAARVIQCAPPHDQQVPAWIVQRGRQAYKLEVRPAAARALRERIGEDLGLLDAALVRLRDQITPRATLHEADIAESTGEHRSPILFEAANALEAADLATALDALEAGFQEGIRIRQDFVTDPRAVAPILLSNLHTAYRKLLRFHMLGDASKLGLSPGAAHHFTRRAKNHRFGRLLARHRLFVEADLALKRSADEPQRILEHLLVGLLS
jgi:DNA polymerase-3 subunit delta